MKKKIYKGWTMCVQCGEKNFPNMKPEKLDCITVHDGICPECGKKSTQIPISDFEYASGDDSKWD